MKSSDVNHLRRLVAWVRTEIGQSPEEFVATMQDVASQLGHPDLEDSAKARLVQAHDKSRAVPKYARDAVKALEKYINSPGVIVPENSEEDSPEILRSTPSLHMISSEPEGK